MPENKGGLEGIVAAQSRISFIDGEQGVLIYQGYDIRDLAEHARFEEIVHLLWHGRLPTRKELEVFDHDLRDRRAVDERIFDALSTVGVDTIPMQSLRTGVSLLGHLDPDAAAPASDREANLRKAATLVAKMPTIVAAAHRLRSGEDPVEPDPSLDHAANFLYMLKGEAPTEEEVATMNTALVLHADHGFNASTFTARIVASTLSDVESAVTAAIGTLKGPLHGGANQAVFRMLEAIGDPANVDTFIRAKLANHERVMGFGHRVYRTMDPRAAILKGYSKRLGEEQGDSRWYEMSDRVQDVMMAEKGLWPNVDFYSASTYHMLGIPTDLFTPIFALSRSAGWTAHILEQYANNRLIRPRAEYVGPKDQTWVPMDER